MKVYNGMSWRELLNHIVHEHKKRNPLSRLTDGEIMESFMEYLIEEGMVTKNADGKFLVPQIGFKA